MPFKRISCRSPITCKYLQYTLKSGRKILLPLIHVELSSESEQLTTIGLIDSGATATFITYELADILNLIPEKPKTQDVSTAGGDARFFPVTLKRLSLLRGRNIFSSFGNLRVLVPSQKKRDLPYVILGRDTVFNRFHVLFKEKRREFSIVHHKWANIRLQ